MQMLPRSLAAALALTAVIAFPSRAAPTGEMPRYRVQDLGVLFGDQDSLAGGISSEGWVVGHSYPEGMLGSRTGQAFLYRDGLAQALGTLGGDYSRARDVNGRGEVIGDAHDAAGQLRPFLWRDGRMQDLATGLGASTGQAWGLNAAGQVAGEADDRAFFFDGTRSRFIEVGTGSSFAAGVNDHGVAVGGAQTSRGFMSFVYQDGRATLLKDPEDFGAYYARDINNAGQILVNRPEDSDARGASYIYDSRTGTYDFIGFVNGDASDINNRGWVVGYTEYFNSEIGDLEWLPTLYRDGENHKLQELLRPQDAGRWALDLALDINDDGTIVGGGWIDGRYHAYVATLVPEPSAGLMLLAGLALVGAAARRKRA